MWSANNHTLKHLWGTGEWVSESRSVVSDSLWPHRLTVHEILQARILEWVAFPFFRGSSQSRDWTQISRIAGRFFTSWATREAQTGRNVESQFLSQTYWIYICFSKDAQGISVQAGLWEVSYTTSDPALPLWLRCIFGNCVHFPLRTVNSLRSGSGFTPHSGVSPSLGNWYTLVEPSGFFGSGLSPVAKKNYGSNVLFEHYFTLFSQKYYQTIHVHACWVAQLYPTLCYSVDCSLPGSSVVGIFQARILEWVAIFFFRRSSRPRVRTGVPCVSCIGRRILYHWAIWKLPNNAYVLTSPTTRPPTAQLRMNS